MSIGVSVCEQARLAKSTLSEPSAAGQVPTAIVVGRGTSASGERLSPSNPAAPPDATRPTLWKCGAMSSLLLSMISAAPRATGEEGTALSLSLLLCQEIDGDGGVP